MSGSYREEPPGSMDSFPGLKSNDIRMIKIDDDDRRRVCPHMSMKETHSYSFMNDGGGSMHVLIMIQLG